MKYPNMSASQLKSLNDYVTTQASTALTATGDIPFSDFAKSNPVEAYGLISAGYDPSTAPSPPTAKQLEQKGKQTETGRNLDILESYLTNSQARGPASVLSAVPKRFQQLIDPNAYQFNELRTAMIGPLARLISGEVGVLTDYDIKRAEGLLPRLEETPEAAGTKLSTLRQLLDQGGEVKAAQTVQPKTPQKGIVQSIVEAVADPFVQTGKTIGGAGVELFRKPGDLSENPFLSQQELSKYDTDPVGQVLNQVGRSAVLAAPAANKALALARPVGGLATAARSGAITFGAYGAAQPQEGLAASERLGNIATSAATGAVTGAAFYGALQVAAKAGKILHPFRTIGDMKRAAVADAQGATINWDNVVSQLESSSRSISPTDRTAYLRFVTNAKSMAQGDIPISQAVDIASRANVAYTSAGKVGKSASAAFNDVLGKALKEQISAVAPGVGEANKLFKLLYSGQKALKGTKNAAMTAGTFKLLGLLGI